MVVVVVELVVDVLSGGAGSAPLTAVPVRLMGELVPSPSDTTAAKTRKLTRQRSIAYSTTVAARSPKPMLPFDEHSGAASANDDDFTDPPSA